MIAPVSLSAPRAPQAPDYPPYTGWAGTTPDDPTTTGFNVEVGLLAEPICGIKVSSPVPGPHPA